ncbi:MULTISPECIES: pilus assembly protein [unclassified Streptomyces]|uniref:pilus assembly protein n=1 Tax=Streptomyces TaxID=1883 RepID=UPI0001C1C510|nr:MULTISPECIES: pilus assembly protein [unclassified Streptomyces]AEN12090.1 TadE family protein [Streptomyces sp. SirexAA-E]MYR68201.1 pilus assembly protein [Streptomyces sp. SID4939]MYS03237.1 pilus assembly protein [Streptomyces sp. SID4940]MYT66869.1 pilus assembly protein [Streptomyces sp. SID8357]MYT88354.1 pilus assembly protein [Streptomyces sp. SID8360]
MRLPGTWPATGPGSAARDGTHGAAPAIHAERHGCRGDRGQAAIEFTGTLPLILVTLALLWQAAVIGYAFTLAGNAVDKAVSAATTTDGSRQAACVRAGREDLPGSWAADFSCGRDGDMVRAEVALKVPLLFPGAFNLPFTVPAEAAAAVERPGG